MGVFTGAASQGLQKLTEEPMDHPHLTKSLVGAITKPAWGRRLVRMSELHAKSCF